jgi:hypothetical protein
MHGINEAHKKGQVGLQAEYKKSWKKRDSNAISERINNIS